MYLLHVWDKEWRLSRTCFLWEISVLISPETLEKKGGILAKWASTKSFETKALKTRGVGGLGGGVRKGVDAGCIALPYLEPSDEKKKTLVFDFSGRGLDTDLLFLFIILLLRERHIFFFIFPFFLYLLQGKWEVKKLRALDVLQRKVLRIYLSCTCRNICRHSHTCLLPIVDLEKLLN